MSVSAGQHPIHRPRARFLTGRFANWIPPVLVVVLAIAVHADGYVTTDVSWLITVGERMLASERLYVDVVETNPPFSVLLYWGPVALARALAVTPEFMILGLTILIGCVTALASLWIMITTRLLTPDQASRAPWILTVLLFLFLILPNDAFAQREHIGMMAMLPALCVVAWRAGAGHTARLSVLVLVAAGIGAGIMLMIKPHYGLALAMPQLYAAIRTRSASPLLGWENWTAGAMLAAYLAGVYAFFPEFPAQILPALLETYVHIWYAPHRNLFLFLVYVLIGGGCLLASLSRPRSVLVNVLLLASLAFFITFYLQGKGWPYHGLPCLITSGLVLFLLMIGTPPPTRHIIQLVGLLVLALSFFWYRVPVRYSPALAAEITRLAPAPAMVAITYDIAIGHPLVRDLKGRWVGTLNAAWRMGGAQFQLAAGDPLDNATRRRLIGHVQWDLALFTSDIAEQQPDVILIDHRNPMLTDAIGGDGLLAAQLASYRSHGLFDEVELLVNTGSGPTSPANP